MNPPTIGHELLVKKTQEIAAKYRGKVILMLSKTQEAKKNPLGVEDKIKFVSKAFQGGNVQVLQSGVKDIITAVKKCEELGFTKVVLVCGDDRVAGFEKIAANNHNDKYFSIRDGVSVVSAGRRDPDSDDATGASATKLRQFAKDEDLESFTKNLPVKLRNPQDAEEIYNLVRKGMKMNEETEQLGERVLTVMDRIRLGRNAKRNKNKLKLGRQRMKHRRASNEKLLGRARKQARMLLRKRFLGDKVYADLSPAERVMIDKRIERIPDSIVTRIAKRLFIKIRQKEMNKFSAQKPQNESLNTVEDILRVLKNSNIE